MANFHIQGAADHLRGLDLDCGEVGSMDRNAFVQRLHNVTKAELQRIASGGAGDKRDNGLDVAFNGDEDSERSLSTVLDLAPKEGGIGMDSKKMADWLKERARKVSAA